MTAPAVQGQSVPLRPNMVAWVDGRYARREVVENTWRAARYHVSKFADHFGDDHDLRVITPEHVENWLALLTVQPQSRNTICSTLRKFFKWAVKRGLVDRDPFADIDNAKVPKRKIRAIPEHVVKSIISNPELDLKSRVILTVIAGTGIRRAEMAKLRVEDWDRLRQTLFIQGKGSKERVIAVDGEVQDALEVWLRDGRTTGPMWPSPRGGGKDGLHPNRIGGIITGASNKLKLHYTPHDYRHTMASLMMLDGAPIAVVRDRLGHESIDTTNIYTHADVEDQRQWIQSRKYYAGTWGQPALPLEIAG